MARVYPVETDPKGPFPLLIGLEGPPGGGKTLSALRLARGIQKVRHGPIIVIDTEAGRSAVYRQQIEFHLVRIEPPFRPTRFLDAIRESVSLDNPSAIIIDSLSDEHEGEGGVLEWQEEEVDRFAGDQKNNWQRRHEVNQAAWIIPKKDRNRLIGGLLHITTPLIFTFRAREKTRPMKDPKSGKMVPTRLGYQAIAPAEICHAMTALCLLPANSDGKPVWRTGDVAQDFLLKRPNYLARILTEAQLDESTGEKLALWAAGGSVKEATDTVRTAGAAVHATITAATSREADGGPAKEHDAGLPSAHSDEPDRLVQVERHLREASELGYRALQEKWNALGSADKQLFKAQRDRILIPRAREADIERMGTVP